MVSAEKLLQNFQPKVCLFRSHPSLSSFFKIITRPFGSLVSFFFLMNILQWLRLAVFMIKALPVEIPEKMRHRRYIFMFLFLFQNLKSSIRLIFLPAHEAYNAADGYVALFSTEEGIANEGKSRWAQPSLCHVSITHHSPSIIAYANTIVFNLPVNFPSAANTSLLHTLLSNNFVFSRLRLCQDIGNPERSKFYLAVRIFETHPPPSHLHQEHDPPLVQRASRGRILLGFLATIVPAKIMSLGPKSFLADFLTLFDIQGSFFPINTPREWRLTFFHHECLGWGNCKELAGRNVKIVILGE